MATDSHTHDDAFLRVRGLTRRYWVRRRTWGKRAPLVAVNDVTFEIPRGKTLALVGSSGSGKSTVARCITRLEKPDAGEIWIAGSEIAQLRAGDLLPFRSTIQMVFQDPSTAMNPRMSAAQIIEEPLLIQGRGNREVRRRFARELIEKVGLAAASTDRRITQFSGGQRQRLAIARALALEPKLLVLDEALSGLDLSTQAQIANLLLDLQVAHSLTYLLISHDLTLVARMADTIAVMSAGQIVEQQPTQQLMSQPAHQETKALLAAARAIEPARDGAGEPTP